METERKGSALPDQWSRDRLGGAWNAQLQRLWWSRAVLVIDFFRAGSWIDLTYSKASLSWPKGLLRLCDFIFNCLV